MANITHWLNLCCIILSDPSTKVASVTSLPLFARSGCVPLGERGQADGHSPMLSVGRVVAEAERPIEFHWCPSVISFRKGSKAVISLMTGMGGKRSFSFHGETYFRNVK